jgi:predicted transposase/invertase (TIGR01784 family)
MSWKETIAMSYVTSWERIARKKGIIDGRVEGRVKGIKENKLETAKKMLMDNLPIDTIAKYTDLAKDEIRPLMQ